MMNLICNDPNSDEVLIYKDGPFRFNSTGDPGHLQKDFTFTVPENASVGTAEFSVTYYPPAQPIPRQVSGFDTNILRRTNYIKFIFQIVKGAITLNISKDCIN